MRVVLSTALLGSALVVSVASPAGAAPPSELAASCEGVHSKDRGTSSCTTTSRSSTSSDLVSARHAVEVTDPLLGPPGAVRHTVGISRTETVVETTTVRSQRGRGAATVSTSERVVSSAVHPVDCQGYTTQPAGPAFAFSPEDFAKCAALGLFVSPTVEPEPALPTAGASASCGGVLTKERGTRTCTTTVTTTLAGDVVKATRTGPYTGPFTSTYYTATSRPVSVVETTTVTSRKGRQVSTTTGTERVVSTAVEPLACHAWTVSLRGGSGPMGLQDLSVCAELGLFGD